MTDDNKKYASSAVVFWGQVKFMLFVGITIIKKNYIKTLLLLIVTAGAVLFFQANKYFKKPEIQKSAWHSTAEKGFITASIPKGIPSRTVLDSLYRKKLITNYNWSLLLIKVFKMENSFKAGKFDIPDSLNDYQTLYYLS
ncbi:MAG: hypothetical protein KAR38_15275, partial [Calditrichia bacterium]|nr:hypothetical protein [Calditrichia bacterium]